MASLAVGVLSSQAGRVLWRFRIPSSYAGSYMAVAGDGTVYASDRQTLYAVAPNGQLKWTATGSDFRRPIQIDRRGTIYAGELQALRPDGSLIWRHTPPNRLVAGPGLGPDGNLYIVAGFGTSHAVYSLAPNGQLRWTRTTTPAILPDPNRQEIHFGAPSSRRFYFNVNNFTSANRTVAYGFDFSGGQTWYTNSSCKFTLARISPNFDLVYAGSGTCGVTAYAESGSQAWRTPPPPNSRFGNPIDPVFGPDGSCYTAGDFSDDMWALNPDGTTRWFRQGGFGLPRRLGVTPDNRFILSGGNATFGRPGWIRAYATSDGALRWQVNLPNVGNSLQSVVSAYPVYSPDGKVAYVLTRVIGGDSFLYAIDLGTTASWNNYGSGWPGAGGIPSLVALNNPTLGQTLTIRWSPAAGRLTAGALLIGSRATVSPTALGGTMLVTPTAQVGWAIPAAGQSIQWPIPNAPSLNGTHLFLQGATADSAASHGVSFTAGLQLNLWR